MFGKKGGVLKAGFVVCSRRDGNREGGGERRSVKNAAKFRFAKLDSLFEFSCGGASGELKTPRRCRGRG